jgi:hypothetical protein
MKMAEATKRPWGYVHHKGLDKHLVGATLENVAIVEDRHGNAKENANLIVKAVNAHDALVGALKHCQIALRTHSPNVPEDEQCWTSYDEEAIEGAYEALEAAK